MFKDIKDFIFNLGDIPGIIYNILFGFPRDYLRGSNMTGKQYVTS